MYLPCRPPSVKDAANKLLTNPPPDSESCYRCQGLLQICLKHSSTLSAIAPDAAFPSK